MLFVTEVPVGTYTEAASTRSLLPGQASSLLGAGAAWVALGCGGAVGVWAAGGGAASGVCGRSCAEEVREVRGLAGSGEEEESGRC